jgi:hypothetical protein
MGTVLRFGIWRVMIYTQDHRASHVHVVSGGGRAKVLLNCPDGPVVPEHARGMDAATLRRLLRGIEAARARLCNAWREIMAHSDSPGVAVPSPVPEAIEQSIELALRRGRALDRTQPRCVAVCVESDQGRLVLFLDNGTQVTVPFALLPAAVAQADGAALAQVRIDGGGHDLYWPSLDQGVYIPDVCAGVTSTMFAHE